MPLLSLSLCVVRFPNPLAPGRHPDTCQLGNLTNWALFTSPLLTLAINLKSQHLFCQASPMCWTWPQTNKECKSSSSLSSSHKKNNKKSHLSSSFPFLLRTPDQLSQILRRAWQGGAWRCWYPAEGNGPPCKFHDLLLRPSHIFTYFDPFVLYIHIHRPWWNTITLNHRHHHYLEQIILLFSGQGGGRSGFQL